MKVIIAGSREGASLVAVRAAVESSGFDVTEVVSGGCRGVDIWGERWAAERGVPVKRFVPDWSVGRSAGPIRNRAMAAYADALVAVWDGASRGTCNMIQEAKARGLPVYICMLPGGAR